MINYLKKNWLTITGAVFVFVLFAYITYKTPLAGDDWGYYLNSLEMSPVQGALSFYQSWSGRFFSELWGFIMPKNKWLWNIVNPLLFTAIFVCLVRLADLKRNKVIGIFVILAIMLSVDDNLRMETYTWIMGTTYIVPLFLSMVYFITAEKLFRSDLNRRIKINSYLSNILLIVIGLMMENIAATMIGGIAILIIYAYFNKKDTVKYLAINLIFSTTAFAVMRMSPGSTYRTMRDAADWMKLSVFEKLAMQYPNFLELTFINNNYMILIFSAVLCLFMLFGAKNMKTGLKIAATGINAAAVFSVFSFVLIKENNIFTDGNSLFSRMFWPIYILCAFGVILMGVEDSSKKFKTSFTLIIAGASSLIMMYSPTFGSRSVIYTVCYIILVALLILEETELKNYVTIIMAVVLLVVTGDRTNEFIYKYNLVGYAQEERLEIIKYYQDHPEEEEAWIPRFPIFTVHGADIEEGDTYHFETFKDYYKLPQSADRIIFYYKES